MPQRSVLFVRVPPVARAIEDAWTRWYDDTHIAYRLPLPGFLGARRYRVDAGPIRTLALYELDDPSALTSPAYLAHRRWEEAQPAERFEYIAPRLPGFARGVYEQQWPDADGYRVPDADAMLIVDLDDAGTDEASPTAWFAKTCAPCALRIDGVRGLRLLTLMRTPQSAASGQRTSRPLTIAMVDLADAGVATSDHFVGAMKACADGGHAIADAMRWTIATRGYSSFNR